jgi:hypothetical protein
VRVGQGGVPVQVDAHSIELVRESWLVEDRWWTGQPLRRRYWEVVSTSGRNIVVFHELGGDRLGGDLLGGDSLGGDGTPGVGTGQERAGGWFVQRS